MLSSTESLPVSGTQRSVLARAGVPPRLQHCSWETWEGKRPEIPGEWDTCLIHGPVGSGKSHIAVAMLLDEISRGSPAGCSTVDRRSPGPFGNYLGAKRQRGCLWRNIQSAVEALKPKDGARSDRLLQDLLLCDFLVFDDFGTQRPTDFALDRVSLILHRRYNEVKSTVITTNLTPSQLNDVDPRLASRFLGGVQIKQTGADYRLGRSESVTIQV